MKRSRWILTASFLFVVVAVGCGSESTPAPAQTELPTTPNDAATAQDATDSPTPLADANADAGSDAQADSDAAPACVAIVNDGAAITANAVAAVAPPATGGAIADGTYHLSDLSVYTGPGGSTAPLPLIVKSTLLINGSTVQFALDAGASQEWGTWTLAMSGSNLTATQTCPTPKPARPMSYSAGATTVTLSLTNDGGQVVAYTYAR